MPAPLDDWTDERVELLKKLWRDGLSGAMCLQELRRQTGAHFSRNAIIGKISRLGLQRTTLGPRSARAKGEKRKPYKPRGESKGDTHVNRDLRAAIPARQVEDVPPVKPLAPPADEPLGSLLSKPFIPREIFGAEHVAERCTYTDNCKEPPIKGRFFCAAHCAIVYRPPTQPKNPKPYHRPNQPRRN